VEINIGKYRITSDEYNITLQHREAKKKGDNIGEEYWVTDGYYRDLEYCCERLLDKRISRSDAKSVKELIACINQAKEEIRRAINEQV
jgi:hypothetical protein